jgi:hypothetical protein
MIFDTKDIPSDQVLDKGSPYQITDDYFVWFIPGYDPPSRTDLTLYGRKILPSM